ncbi:MAG: hypothetical protein C0393_01920 [Anaerolinea sp.]|nr:hypothetical protein [Anaerolinea sp.]
MSTMIAIPDELVEQVKSVARTEALEKFFINAARKQVREIRARQLREEYERTHRRLTPHQVYERTLAGVVAFELKYGLSSDQFLRDFEAGVIDEDRDDWGAFYRWRTMAYGLRRIEKEYGFKREAQSSGKRFFS